jgi:hypothetical protein
MTQRYLVEKKSHENKHVSQKALAYPIGSNSQRGRGIWHNGAVVDCEQKSLEKKLHNMIQFMMHG